MEKLKVKVRNAAESKEAQELFFSLGVSWRGSDSRNPIVSILNYPFFVVSDFEGLHLTDSKIFTDFKKITLQELRDMVVLKRNEPDDANFENKVTGIKYFVSSAGDIYFWCGDWQKCHASFRIEKLNSIKEDVMKEYLVKTDSGIYLYAKNVIDVFGGAVIEIPEGANVYARCNIFGDYKWLPKIIDGDWSVLWQREKESINDQVVTAEVARQEEKHSHYKKDVSHLNVIDPYRIADLYGLHPCAEHIMKKSLCAGNRGHKDKLRDIQDIIDTAERWKQMIGEDSNEI